MPGVGRRKARGAAALMLVFFSVMATICSAGEAWYGYDQFGRLIRSIDEQNRVTDYVYDAAGNILEVQTNVPAQAPAITAITPGNLRRGESKQVQVTGTNLLEVSITAADPGLQISHIQRFQASDTQISVTLTAAAMAVLGTQSLTFSNQAGSTSAAMVVNPLLPKPSFLPAPLAVPPDGTTRQFTLRLSNADTIAHTIAFAVANTAVVSVTPSITIPAGQTDAIVSITGLQAGQTVLNWTSSTLGNSSDVLYITSEYVEMQRAYSGAVRVNLLAPPQPPTTTTTTIGPVVSPAVRVIIPQPPSTLSTTTVDPVVSPLVRVHVTVFPTANAGPDQSVNAGAAVTLSGSGSDPDGSIASFAWTQTAGPAVTLSGATTATATFTTPPVTADTVLTFQLTVTDNQGATGTASVNVTVHPNTPPIANAGADQSVNKGAAVTLSGSGSDPDGTVASFAWSQIAEPTVTLTNVTTASFTAPQVTANTVLALIIAPTAFHTVRAVPAFTGLTSVPISNPWATPFNVTT